MINKDHIENTPENIKRLIDLSKAKNVNVKYLPKVNKLLIKKRKN